MVGRKTKQGDLVEVTVPVENREAFYRSGGKEGTTRINLNEGQRVRSATDELGGNIFAETTTSSGDEVLVPLGEGEWRLA